jgi:hypothetical protein
LLAFNLVTVLAPVSATQVEAPSNSTAHAAADVDLHADGTIVGIA